MARIAYSDDNEKNSDNIHDANQERMRTWRESFEEYGRGVIGGLIFSLPLLYTREVWEYGFIAESTRLLLYIGAIFALLLAYNRFAGLRRDASSTEVAIDSIEEMGIGLALAGFLLWLLGRLTPEMGWAEIVGKVVMAGMTIAIGVSVGTAQIGEQNDDTGEAEAPQNSQAGTNPAEQMAITLCGGMLFAANIAPTQEVVLLGTQLNPVHLLMLVLVSLVLAAFVLFFSGMGNQNQLNADPNSFSSIAATAAITYAVALLASASTLWFFNRFEGLDIAPAIGQTVVLALPTVLGAALGKLLL